MRSSNDPSPDAYEKLVDRLLASPHYGERWARRWLDLARYADTNGYEKDRPRIDLAVSRLGHQRVQRRHAVRSSSRSSNWPATCSPTPRSSRRSPPASTATRCSTKKAASTRNEYRFLAMVDRVSTTGTAWLGLTIGCAQCHTHKYDPITHKEYYQLMAFLDNADEPQLEVPSPDVARRDSRRSRQKIAKLTAELPGKFPVQAERLADAGRTVYHRSRQHARTDRGRVWRFTGKSPEKDTYQFQFDTGPEPVDRFASRR